MGDCLVCCVGSHGSKGDKITLFNKKNSSEEDVDSLFFIEDFADCEGLKNKPKLFILQACRGGKYEQGALTLRKKGKNGTRVEEQKGESDYLAESLSANLPDVLLACSTIPDMRATRNPSGSVYVKTMMEVARKFPEKEICQILTMVNGKVAIMKEFYGDGDGSGSRCLVSEPTSPKASTFPLRGRL